MNKELTIKIGTKKFTYDMLKKECLAIQMIPVAGNEERLASMPHTRFFDIAATYHFVITLGGAKFDLRITNELLDAFGVSAKQLQEDAVENAPKRFPMQIHSVAEEIEAMPEEKLKQVGRKCILLPQVLFIRAQVAYFIQNSQRKSCVDLAEASIFCPRQFTS